MAERQLVEGGKELVQRYYNATFDEVVGMTDEVIAEEFVMHDPNVPEEVRGRDGLVEYYRTFDEAMSDLRLESEDVFAEENTVAVRWTARGTHDRAEFQGIEPTGTEFSVSGIDIVRLEDGMIAECWSHYDALGLIRQLGALPEDFAAETTEE